jgi:adenine deaminase
VKDEAIVQGNIVDVVAGKIIRGTLRIRHGMIAGITEEAVDSNLYIIPGFIDSHVHVESSMLIPTEFARLAVLHGTVATISDPHEIGNVLGVSGVKFMIENGRKTPFKFHFGAPSCVPATKNETAGAEINAEAVAELLALPEISYLAEVMNYPGVLHSDPEVMAKIRAAQKLGKPVDGHAPGLRGEDAKKYIEAGISTDHECVALEEALEKIGYGMKILIREGSAAKNFNALIPLLNRHPEKIMFCTDDSHPNTLRNGHINLLAKRAVAYGCDLFNVLRACSKNTVEHYSMDVGLLQPGDPADFCVVEDLVNFNIVSTYIDGVCVASNRKSHLPPVAEQPVNHFHRKAISTADIRVEAKSNRVRVIVVHDGQLITTEEIAGLDGQTGFLESDPSQDVLKIAVVNRYGNTPPAVGFIRNIGLKRGAIASTVAHDSHNIIATGVSDEDLVRAINLVIECKGGVAWCDGSDSDVIPLPVAGIMTHKDAFETAARYDQLQDKTKALGTTLYDPFMTLSFCALLVIPELKLSDLGLFDCRTFGFTSLYV